MLVVALLLGQRLVILTVSERLASVRSIFRITTDNRDTTRTDTTDTTNTILILLIPTKLPPTFAPLTPKEKPENDPSFDGTRMNKTCQYIHLATRQSRDADF